MAILTDKSGVLEEAARRDEERQARLTAPVAARRGWSSGRASMTSRSA
jgi:hypothetical protein